jgi:hypothetical protein
MKRVLFGIGCAACVWGWAVSASAMTSASPGTEGSLLKTDSLYPLTIGVDFDHRERELSIRGPGGPNDILQVESISAVVSVRLLPWLAPFVTIGSADTDLMGYGDDSSELVWSLGVQASLWEQEIVNPEFLSGRMSLRAVGEWTEGDLSSQSGVEGDWTELNVSMLLCYELFVDQASSRDSVPYSLEFYAGPTWSRLDGDANTPAGRVDFESDRDILITLGADLFLSDNLSVGGAVRLGDETSWRAGFRFHF